MKFRISNQQAKEYMERRRYELRVAEIKRRLQEDYNVFISYSHSDNLLAQQLTSLFNKFKINYIIDEKELDWGDKIADFAREEITACSHYLLILSEASTKSQWCQLEFGMAYGLKKEMLIFLANKKVELPGFATNILATSDIKLVSGYFSQGLIDPQDVDRFIKEIINDQQANLKDFKHGSECEEEHKCWDAPDSDDLKSDTLGTRPLYLDDFVDTSVYRLSRIELGEPFASEAVVLHYHKPSIGGTAYVRFTLMFCKEVNALIIEPNTNRLAPFEDIDEIGVREKNENGDERISKRRSTLRERLDLKSVYGFDVSRSFWEKTFTTLKQILPA